MRKMTFEQGCKAMEGRTIDELEIEHQKIRDFGLGWNFETREKIKEKELPTAEELVGEI